MNKLITKLKTSILWISYCFLRNRNSKIIFYHDVHQKRSYTSMSTPIDVFKAHVAEIKNNNFTIVNQISKPKNQIQIGFDDGFLGIYDNKDYFVKERIFPTIFLAIELIGKEGYLNEKQIIEMQNLGFNFESHGYSHSNLVLFSDEELQYELAESKRFLEKLLQKKITEICFPIGYFSERVCQQARELGYNKMHSSLPGDYFNQEWKGVVNRNLVQFSSPKELKYIIHGAFKPFRFHYKKRQFLTDKH